MKIQAENIIDLKKKIKHALLEAGIDANYSLLCENEDEWSMTLKVSRIRNSIDKIEHCIENFFKRVGVDEDRMVYLEDVKSPGFSEWYFTHPNTPKSILKKQDMEIEEEERQEERESIRKYEEHRKMLRDQGLIIKPRTIKSKNTDLFYVMSRDNFNEIESGTKKVEYRTYNSYHIDKCLGRGAEGVKTLVFQLGYGGPGHQDPKKIKFKSDGIYLCDDTMEEIPAFQKDGRLTDEKDLPDGFIPMLLAIHIGDRIK